MGTIHSDRLKTILWNYSMFHQLIYPSNMYLHTPRENIEYKLDSIDVILK